VGAPLAFTTNDFAELCKSRSPQSLLGFSLQGVPKTMFSDIGGLEEVKSALKEVVFWANHHHGDGDSLSAALRISPPRGVLLYGPPGTGKTMLARAVAHEATANFISVDISDLSQSEVGESEKALKTLFRRASQSRPSVIFLDEVQALFTARAAGKSNTLHSQLVLELDNAPEGVIVLAATNAPHALDEALLRPGRLDVALFIPPPALEGRKAILTQALSNLSTDSSVDISKLAEETEGFTGADLFNLCNTAGLLALRNAAAGENSDLAFQISQTHLEKVLRNTLPSVSPETVEKLRNWEISKKEAGKIKV